MQASRAKFFDDLSSFLEKEEASSVKSLLNALEEDDTASLIAGISFEFEGRPNLRLAAAVAERMTADEAQALYRFVVKVTKLY